MQTHSLQPNTKSRSKKTVGRGGTRGKTSGRGHKGQNARAGNSNRPAMRDIIKKIPKLRGYRFNSIQEKPQVVNVGQIEDMFSVGEEVTPLSIAGKGLVTNRKGGKLAVKVLGNGDIKKKLIFSGCKVSESARAKIVGAGGSIS